MISLDKCLCIISCCGGGEGGEILLPILKIWFSELCSSCRLCVSPLGQGLGSMKIATVEDCYDALELQRMFFPINTYCYSVLVAAGNPCISTVTETVYSGARCLLGSCLFWQRKFLLVIENAKSAKIDDI